MAALRPCIVMPLYIYPSTTTTWKPLYDAITAHPSLDFLIIVNPNSGPGADPLPGADYVRELPKLNAFPNVRTVGYIAIDYCRKSRDAVCDEIQAYANWDCGGEHQIPGLYVSGVFLDETPNHPEGTRTWYLERVRRFVKDAAAGLRGERLIIHNPGTPPEYSLLPLQYDQTPTYSNHLAQFGNPDAVCVSEVPWEAFKTGDVQARLQTYRLPYARSMFQISGVPLDEVAAVAAHLCRRGRYVFVTDRTEGFYEGFGESWGVFVEAVAEAGGEGGCEGEE